MKRFKELKVSRKCLTFVIMSCNCWTQLPIKQNYFPMDKQSLLFDHHRSGIIVVLRYVLISVNKPWVTSVLLLLICRINVDTAICK